MRYLYALIVALFLTSALNAQVNLNLNFNLNRQPAWGPAGYDYVEYYYLPDIEVYYSVPRHRYYYFEGGRWIYRSSLPARYRHYDLYNSHKVVVNEREPWRHHETYRGKYSSFKGMHDQQLIRDNRKSRSFERPNHPGNNNRVMEQRHDNGNHKGWDKGSNGNGRNKENRGNDNRDKKERGNGRGRK
ncbi:MAG: hypothetical protein Q8903_07425 [Bacteroidota bacterium]|nr:hypothetical protein [Bacteroidota bacterium]